MTDDKRREYEAMAMEWLELPDQVDDEDVVKVQQMASSLAALLADVAEKAEARERERCWRLVDTWVGDEELLLDAIRNSASQPAPPSPGSQPVGTLDNCPRCGGCCVGCTRMAQPSEPPRALGKDDK